LHNPDFSAFARTCGALGVRVESIKSSRNSPAGNNDRCGLRLIRPAVYTAQNCLKAGNICVDLFQGEGFNM